MIDGNEEGVPISSALNVTLERAYCVSRTLFHRLYNLTVAWPHIGAHPTSARRHHRGNTVNQYSLLYGGHSLGALIAACYSSTFPEQVTGLLQIEGAAPLAEQSDRAVQRLREGIISREQVRSQVTRGYASFAAALRHRAQVNRLGPELIQPVVERGLVERDGRWFWRHDRQLQTQSAYRMPAEQASAFIQGIRCPHCLILGRDGYTDLPQTAAVLLSKQCTILTIVGGHHCHLEQPENVAQTMLEYID